MTTQDPASPNGDLHVIFGAGQVGPLLAQHLLDAGHRVRVVRRGNQSIAPQIELISGDATDREFCAGAAMGGSVVYHCMNPAEYNAKIWADLVPKYMDNLIAAARTAGARLVVLDNLYMLGRPNGKPLTEKTPVNPCSKKGEIRAKTAEKLFAAHNKGEVAAITGRASDFYGPRARLGFLGDPFWKPALSGRKVRTPINPDAVHTYHYVPDVAAGLAALGSAPSMPTANPGCSPANPPKQCANSPGGCPNISANQSTSPNSPLSCSRPPECSSPSSAN